MIGLDQSIMSPLMNVSAFVKMCPGSDVDAPGAAIDEKKRKRMISNRESARRSRMKRQKHIEDLVTEIAALEKKIFEDKQTCTAILQSHSVLDSENEMLRAQKMELEEYLTYLNQILSIGKQKPDCNKDVPEPLLNPWQAHGLVHPITASGCSSSVTMG